MPAPPVIDRTWKWPDKCQAITAKGACQCSRNPYTGDFKGDHNPEENHKPRFCYQHRTLQSRKHGEVTDPTQANVTDMNSQAHQPPSVENLEKDTNMYPPPLKFPTTTKAAFHDALPHEDQFQQFGIDFAFNPTKSNQSIRDQESRSPRTASASDINMHESYADAESNHWQSKGKRSAIQNQAINESHALQSVIAQLNRIELRGASGASKEDVQRLETSCASKANVESLEIRVQHLEKAIHRLPGSDQMPESHEEIIMKMNSTLSEHLTAIQRQHDFVCTQRDETGRRADGLHRSSESARRMWLSTLQKYHENNREHKLRDEQAQYLLRLKQGIEARILEQGIETRISEQRIMSESISSDHMTIEEEL